MEKNISTKLHGINIVYKTRKECCAISNKKDLTMLTLLKRDLTRFLRTKFYLPGTRTRLVWCTIIIYSWTWKALKKKARAFNYLKYSDLV